MDQRKLDLMLEAERRGILPPDKTALLGEARKRGLIPGGEQPQPDPAAPPDVGWVEGALRHAAQSGTLGFADEVEGAIRAIGPESYDESVALARARNDAAPLSAKIAGGLAGAIAVPGMGLGGLVARGATTGARIARGVGVGALEGAVAGLGAGEGDLVERLPSAATGAAIGAPLGALGGALTRSAPDSPGEFAIPLTKGQKSGDFAQLAKEETLRKAGGSGQNTIRNFDEVQRNAIGQAAETIVPGVDNVAAAAGRATGEIRAAKQGLKNQVTQAYAAFQGKDGFLRKDAGMDLHNRLVSVLDDPQRGRSVNPDIRKKAAGTLDEISDLMAPITGVEHVTLNQVDGVRKSINRAIGGAKNDPEYESALKSIKREYDDWLEQAVSSTLYSGDADALKALKDARALSARYQSIFKRRPGDSSGQIITKLIDDDATPEQAINGLFGMRKLSKSGTVGAVARIKRVAPDALPPLQQAGWARMTHDEAGELRSAHMIAKTIREHINSAPELMKALYGAETVAKMGRFADELQRTVTPKDAVNTSNTFNRLADFMRKKLGIASFAGEAAVTASMGVPTMGVGSLLTQGGLAAADYATARAATRAIQNPRLPRQVPGVAAASAVPLISGESPSLLGAPGQ